MTPETNVYVTLGLLRRVREQNRLVRIALRDFGLLLQELELSLAQTSNLTSIGSVNSELNSPKEN
jgi:hypothetical protein